MKTQQLKQLIKEEILKIFEEEEQKLEGDTSTLITNLKNLGVENVDPSKISTTINLVKQNKNLNNAANKILADILVAMIKSDDMSLLNKIFANIKKIKTM